jgi:hypothetical protein
MENQIYSQLNEEIKSFAKKFNADHDFEIRFKFLMGVMFPMDFKIQLNFKDGRIIGQGGSRFRSTFNTLQKWVARSENLPNSIPQKQESEEEKVCYPESFTEDITLKDMAENVYPAHISFIKKVIELYKEFEYHIRTDFCQICDAPLNEQEKSTLRPEMNCITCAKHRKQADVFDINRARTESGYPEIRQIIDFEIFTKEILFAYRRDEEEMRKNNDQTCMICYKELTPKEKQISSPFEFSRACEKHKKYADKPQTDMIRKELGYPLTIPVDI